MTAAKVGIHATDGGDLALVLSGGGARGAYQVGFLRALAEHRPGLQIPIVTGVSAGAINAAYLASQVAEFRDKAETLARLWAGLTTDQIFRVYIASLARNVLSWGARFFMGQASRHIQARSLVDTSPLCAMLDHLLQPVHRQLPGIAQNLVHGGLKAVAVTASSYSTGQSLTWVQGDPPAPAHGQRKFMRCRLRIDHILASAALPLLFPAVRINRRWFGDGGIRMTAPLAPAVHLGAEKILAISTRYARSPYEQERPQIDAYPPPAQVVGALFNAIFLDLFDNDAVRLQYKRSDQKDPRVRSRRAQGDQAAGPPALTRPGSTREPLRIGLTAQLPVHDPRARYLGNPIQRHPEPAPVPPRLSRAGHGARLPGSPRASG
jgi:NTE family protein